MSDKQFPPAFPAKSEDFVEYVPARNWIGGQWRDATTGKTQPVDNPRWAKDFSSVPLSGAEDVDLAVQAAARAFATWSRWPMRERAQIFYKLRELMERDVEELSWLVVHENGKTYDEAKASVLKGIECVEFGASLPNSGGSGEELEVSRGVVCKEIHEPLGVVAGVTPFNFPVMVPLWMLPQAIVGGNTFVLKPSERVPLGAMKLAALLKEAGLPDGVFNIVNGAADVVNALCDHPKIRAMAFVGSTKVAKHVYGRGAATGKTMLCLGGAKNHLILVPDADVKVTAENVVASFTGCAGQRCMAASVLVAVGDVSHVMDAVVEKAKTLQAGKDIGPIITKQAADRIRRYIDEAEKAGAKVIVDGRAAEGQRRGLLGRPDHHRRRHAGDGGVEGRDLRPGAERGARQEPRRGHRAREQPPVRQRLVHLHNQRRRGRLRHASRARRAWSASTSACRCRASRSVSVAGTTASSATAI